MRGFSAAGNTMVPAYLTLLQKGYMIRQTRIGDDEHWVAEKDDWRFGAEDPLSLLGIVAIHEVRGEAWKADDEQIESFLQQHYP
jgi:hypothetical protein